MASSRCFAARGALSAVLGSGCLYSPRDSESETVVIVGTRDVDILFVIDNSGTMAEEQLRLSQNFASFIQVLESKDVDANYRIGITTSDSGNPRCPASTYTPENGALVLSSCLDRVDDDEFRANGEDFSSACTDFCAKRNADLKVVPTTTQYDSKPAPRAWIERIDGKSNIGGVSSNVEAFRCYGPQGVAGCGFEQQLESMYHALVKASDKNYPSNYGFLRESAILSIIIITDEADCSYQEAQKEIFTTNKVFWYDPNEDVAPTSAVCWKAGVECTGTSPYSECHAANYGLDGAVGAPKPEAVLRPVSDYIDFVRSLEAGKRAIDDSQRVVISLIAGVPLGYDTREAEIAYADSPDEFYQENFGIGPGCVWEETMGWPSTAVPPVREREFAEAFIDPGASGRNLYTICQDDYSAALRTIAERIRDRLEPLCLPRCALDTVPDSATLEPNCQVFEDSRGVRTELPLCIEIDGKRAIPAGATACYGMRTDPGQTTTSELDDMSRSCVDEGSNLEFVLLRAIAAAEGATISAKCELSGEPNHDCPLL